MSASCAMKFDQKNWLTCRMPAGMFRSNSVSEAPGCAAVAMVGAPLVLNRRANS
jgi:hypothetical protein